MKASAKKAARKATKASAVAASAHADKPAESIFSCEPGSFMPKWAKDGVTRMEAPSTPLPAAVAQCLEQLEHSRLETHEARRLSEELDRTSHELESLSGSAQDSLDALKLALVTSRFLRILERNSERGGAKAQEAITMLVELSRRCCRTLELLADHKNSGKILKVVASEQAEWPVMLSPKESSRVKINDYLNSLGVGTRRIIPTSPRSRISADNRWTKPAAKLIQRIRGHRETLEKQARKEESPFRQLLGLVDEYDDDPFFDIKLSNAREWTQVLNLPRELNSDTWKDWWAVALAMLEADWKANPTEKEKLFDSVKISAKSQIRTKKPDPGAVARSLKTESKNLIIKAMRKAFRAIACH